MRCSCSQAVTWEYGSLGRLLNAFRLLHDMVRRIGYEVPKAPPKAIPVDLGCLGADVLGI